MINKKLLSFDRKALRYVGLNVLFQWLGMLCNVVLVMTVSRLIGGVFAGSLTGNALWQGMLLCLLTVPVRYGLTLCASDMSDRASKDVKRTLRSSIYAKLTRLGAGYSETVATSEAVMLASEGVEQIDTYFAKYLPQLFYSLLAPVTLFVLLVGVHARSAILLLCCVPLIPLSIVAVQKFAKKLLANYWGEYTTLGDSFLENLQGLTIPQGSFVSLVGESGCGKSTIAVILSGARTATEGEVTLGGIPVSEWKQVDRLRLLTLVPHNAAIFKGTVEANLRIARRDATRAEVEAACRKAALDGFINSLPKEYDTPVGELGGALSGGERQRIGVARAFLHDAPFLLLDEPTSNLDSLNEGIILKAVRDECREKTVLLVSHRRSTMAVADLSFSVESGRLS